MAHAYRNPNAHEVTTRDGLVEEYLPLVEFLARRLRMRLPAHVEIDDLVHSGILGLMDAIEKFDESRGIKFKTYAEFRIRGAIFDALRELDWVPRSIRKQKKTVERVSSRLEQQMCRRVTSEEICQKMGMELDAFHRMQEGFCGATLGRFIELGADDGGDMRDGDVAIAYIADSSSDDPHDVFARRELESLLGDTIAFLPEKERMVVSLYYYDELTMKEIGRVLGVTESRVSQLHSKAMIRLRDRMKSRIRMKPTSTYAYAQAM